MTQYFYDFKNLVPGVATPPGLTPLYTGEIADPATHERILVRPEQGTFWWLKNIPGPFTNFSFDFFLGPDVSSADVECLVKLECLFYNGGTFSNDGPSFLGRVPTRANRDNGYMLALPGSPSSTGSFARKILNDSNTTLTGSSGGIDRNSPVWIRFQMEGPNLRIKTWADGVTEPGTWTQEWTDSDISAAGFFGFGFIGAQGDGTLYHIHQLSFGTEGDAAPSSPAYTVSGTVLEPDDSPSSGSTVRCYSRVTGSLVGETATNGSGAFSFTLASADEVYVVAIDDNGDTWNARIKDLITPD